MRSRNEFIAGAFIVAALGLFLLSIWIMGRERQIFASQQEFHTTFRDVKGLAEGAPVRLGGIAIGRVADIRFGTDALDPSVYVTLLINDDFLVRIREDSVVSVETQGLLGDRFISISTGTSPQARRPGSTIPSVEPQEIGQIIARAGQIVDETAEITQHVRKVVGQIEAETVADVAASAKSLREILSQIEQGRGFIHRLIYSPEDGEQLMTSIVRSARDVRALLRQARSGQGLMHSLLFAPEGKEIIPRLNAALTNMGVMADGIGAIAKQVQEGDGLLHRIVYDPAQEGLGNLLSKLNTAANNIEAASRALASGTGTLGALLLDASLYDNLMEITDGAKRSIILREAIRASLRNSKGVSASGSQHESKEQ